ncbi:MAG TPA: 2-hydroxy-3-oxopropionate reductase [Nocardioidaceae bacterium]|nr:2-hydroxy-3-oxopropionate reductase [Nocardioidaceae bacterium]
MPATPAGSVWSTSPAARPSTASSGCRASVAAPARRAAVGQTQGGRAAMTNVAFIGLGIMGSPMAANLARAGHHVVGYNRTQEKTASLVEAGGRAAHSIAEAVAEAEVVAVMVPDSADVQEVLAGEAGVFARVRSGALVVDFSTIRPDVTVELASQAAAHDLRLLDAPVSGGEAGAVNGTLSIMVGGGAADVTRAKPILDVVGSTIVHVGPSGSGQTVKAANQLIAAANLEVLAEAVVFLEAHGVDTAAALQVLGSGMAGSKMLEHKAEKMLSRSFDPGFRVELHHKDLGIVTAAAREAGVAVPLGAVVAQLMASAKAVGDGDLDHSALLRGVERLSGR